MSDSSGQNEIPMTLRIREAIENELVRQAELQGMFWISDGGYDHCIAVEGVMHVLDVVKAVLKEMREPTNNQLESDQMARVGLNDAYRIHASPDYGAAWTAMIDAALEEDLLA